jgi:hypothetical protein
VVRDLKDMLFHSYFSIMDDLRLQTPPGGKPYEIRFASCLCLVLALNLYDLHHICKLAPFMVDFVAERNEP